MFVTAGYMDVPYALYLFILTLRTNPSGTRILRLVEKMPQV